MTFALTSPVTGAPQTGFTSPTYTLTADTPPSNNGKQWVVSALGGTQTGVNVHSISVPFTVSAFRPQNPQVLGPVNPVTGALTRVPTNTHKVIVRKGVTPLAGQPSRNFVITCVMEAPAGSDSADAANLRAALSLAFGALWQQASGVGDTVISGTL